jgi:hypothetical protein
MHEACEKYEVSASSVALAVEAGSCAQAVAVIVTSGQLGDYASPLRTDARSCRWERDKTSRDVRRGRLARGSAMSDSGVVLAASGELIVTAPDEPGPGGAPIRVRGRRCLDPVPCRNLA